MKESRLGPSQDPLKVSNFTAIYGKLSDICALLTRIALFVFLIASISFALHSAFFPGPTRIFQIPTRIQPEPDTSSPAPEDDDPGPTNISHIFFGIGASVNTWHDRSRYVDLWWDQNTTRGNVWLDKKPAQPWAGPAPYRVSHPDWTRFKFSSSQAAVRIARIVLESFRVGAPRVRWFVMGDDDTVFFTENLVSVLSGYDHREMFYVGASSESVEQDSMHSYDMAFGGGGFALSYPLAARLADALNACLDRYHYFYGSDQRIAACVHDVGAALTLHRGFHQLDIRGDPYGLLAAHPLVPLVSLHHLDYLDPIIPVQTRIHSVKTLIKPYRVDPRRILQQCFCYDKMRRWSVSISWGYTLQIYPFAVPANDLRAPLRTFKTWRSSSDGPFTFDTRPVSPDPCRRPVVYFLDRVEAVGGNGTLTSYEMFVSKQDVCISDEYRRAVEVRRVVVSSTRMDDDYWKKAPRRQCCDIMEKGSVNNGTLRIRIRKCKQWETIAL